MSGTDAQGDAPDLFVQALAAAVRHLLTVAAGALGAEGVLSKDQQSQFVSLGVALALAAASYAWSVVQKRNARKPV